MTELCQIFMITLWMVSRFEKNTFYEFGTLLHCCNGRSLN